MTPTHAITKHVAIWKIDQDAATAEVTKVLPPPWMIMAVTTGRIKVVGSGSIYIGEGKARTIWAPGDYIVTDGESIWGVSKEEFNRSYVRLET